MTKNRAIVYARASLDMTGEGRSVERQVGEVRRKLISPRDWIEVAEPAIDNSISAYGGKHRPGWERVLELVETGQVDYVAAYHMDRLTRSMVDLERLILLTEEHDVGIATAVGDIDLTTDMGRMVARILAAVARAEVERKAARQKLANAQLAQTGKPWAGGARPFGYTDDQTEVVVDEARAIREAAELVLGGTSLREIARRWDAAGLVSSRSGMHTKAGWTGRGVKYLLASPRYAGMRTYLGEVVGQGNWPAILDEATHRALVRKLTDPNRSLGKNKQGGRTPQNLLTGLATCSVCDKAVSATASKGKPIYACTPTRHINVQRPIVERAVHGEVVAYLVQPKLARLLEHRGDQEAAEAAAELESIDEKLDELVAAFATSELDVLAYTAAAKVLHKRREVAERAVKATERAPALVGLDLGTQKAAKQWAALPLARQRAFIETFFDIELDRIEPSERYAGWNPDKHMTISLKGSDD